MFRNFLRYERYQGTYELKNGGIYSCDAAVSLGLFQSIPLVHRIDIESFSDVTASGLTHQVAVRLKGLGRKFYGIMDVG